MRRSIVVPIVLSSWSLVLATLTGCASLTQQCATVLLESMAQVCVDVICDEGEDGDIVDVPDERHNIVRDEPPAPDWRPREGECKIARSDVGTHVPWGAGSIRPLITASASSLWVLPANGFCRYSASYRATQKLN